MLLCLNIDPVLNQIAEFLKGWKEALLNISTTTILTFKCKHFPCVCLQEQGGWRWGMGVSWGLVEVGYMENIIS